MSKLFMLLAVCLVPASAIAQRDPPVWESYLASQSIFHNADQSLTLELLFKKEGGLVRHSQHQMYLFVYLAKNERQILEHATDKSLLDKEKSDPMLIDVLLAEKLIYNLNSKVGTSKKRVSQDAVGGYGFDSDAFGGRKSLGLNTFRFEFTIANQSILDGLKSLADFQEASLKMLKVKKWSPDVRKSPIANINFQTSVRAC